MSRERRLALLDWVAHTSAWIIEDEYDAEYRYFGSPVPALQSFDRSGSVIYIGTFTKMLFNALRLGFLVLPDRLVSTFERFRSFVDRHPPTLEQAVLAEFILEGHFGHHVRRMRQIYAERLATLREAAQEEMGGLIDVEAAGLAAAQETAPPKSLPYVAVHDPQFISASDARFMTDEDRVIGLMSGRVAKAFPAGILSQHGLVEDPSPKGPIAITW
jgi:DNA-binding transcriptional MocR family regulator